MGAQMKAVLGLMAVLLAGCANEVGRYQIISIPPGQAGVPFVPSSAATS
jgi:hypothetical protein